jgi:hypothetical protein
MPTNVNLSVETDSGTVMEYLPSKSVMAPMVVPTATILTPGRGVLSSACVTTPLMVRVWAYTPRLTMQMAMKISNLFM